MSFFNCHSVGHSPSHGPIILVFPLTLLATLFFQSTWALSSSFLGLQVRSTTLQQKASLNDFRSRSNLVMRKQKSSDKRTARLQRGIVDSTELSSFTPPSLSSSTKILSSSILTESKWKEKNVRLRVNRNEANDYEASGGRGRARKRLKLYNSFASYHSTFLELITAEYQLEEAEVITRIESSISDPFSLELSGHALFDIHPQRRGNFFSDEVYRLEKAWDATTTFFASEHPDDMKQSRRISPLPPNHKFACNDVVVISLQPRGTGDFLGSSSVPIQKDAVLVEARVLNIGPTYVDIAIPAGKFSNVFGPASNNIGDEGKGDPNMRVRVDRFFSDVPYKRMVSALGQLTSLQKDGRVDSTFITVKRMGGFQMDSLLKDSILSTFANTHEMNSLFDDFDRTQLAELAKKLAKPPLPASNELANQVMTYIQVNPNQLFPTYNEPQLTAIRAALTRRLTLIQGPPGTGKTTTASTIAFGFVHQCRNVSPYCKVLATAFSNVGADNLAEKFLSLGLKIVRVGKPSGVMESLRQYTLDAAIQRDPNAQKALEEAAKMTAKIRVSTDANGMRKNKGSILAKRKQQDDATSSVKASIQACNIAATKALREADVIVATSIGAADAQLLAACGIYAEDDDSKKISEKSYQSQSSFGVVREFAPDNLPPLSIPFVIIDEACQSVEPASLIPIVSTNTCRSLVMLGDPCQLPPTVRSDNSSTGDSPLSISLMARLASIPDFHPVTVTAQKDRTPIETKFMECKATRQAVSKVINKNNGISYRKQFSGSLLLSMQFRMHPSIAAFSSAIFYDSLLSSPLSLTTQRQFPKSLRIQYPVNNPEISIRFVHVGGRNNEEKGRVPESSGILSGSSVLDSSQNSYSNEVEVREVLSVLRTLLGGNETTDGDIFQGSIGIVTPYSSQVALIKSMMVESQEVRMLTQRSSIEIEVKSVDAYQGRERDIIVFSAVRSNRQGRVGFLSDWRRMNVALTRAKSGLIVIGDADTLREDEHWSAFVSWCKNSGCYADKSS